MFGHVFVYNYSLCVCSHFGFKPRAGTLLPRMGKRGADKALAGDKKARRASASQLGPSKQAASQAVCEVGDGEEKIELTTKGRRQLGRRSSEETIERAIQTKFVHIPSEVLETKRFDGLLIRDRIKADRAALVKGQRLGAKYWDSLLNEVGDQVEGLGPLRPEAKDHRVTPNLLRNVSCASDSVFCGSSCLDIAFDFSTSSIEVEPHSWFLRFCPPGREHLRCPSAGPGHRPEAEPCPANERAHQCLADEHDQHQRDRNHRLHQSDSGQPTCRQPAEGLHHPRVHEDAPQAGCTHIIPLGDLGAPTIYHMILHAVLHDVLSFTLVVSIPQCLISV